MTQDPQAPATKQDLQELKIEILQEVHALVPATKVDIQMIMESIGKLYDANERWKNEIIQKLFAKNEEWKFEIYHQFNVVIEDLRHDFLGSTNDRLEDHSGRITRIEKHVGLAA